MKIGSKILNKILITTILTISVFGTGATYIVYTQIRTYLEENTIKSFTTLLEQQNQSVKFSLDTIKQDLTTLALNPRFGEILSQDNIDINAVYELIRNFENIERYLFVFVLDENGFVINSTDPTLLNNNYSFREYFTKAVEGETFLEVAYGVTTQELGYYLSTPVIKNQEVLGVIVFKIDPKYFDQILSTQISEEHEIKSMVVERTGVVISTTDENKYLKGLGKPTTEQSSIREVDRKYQNLNIQTLEYQIIQNRLSILDTIPKSFQFKDTAENTEENLLVAKIEDYPLYGIIEIDETYYSNIANNTAKIIAALVFAAATTTIILISFVISRILKPIQIYNNIAKEILSTQEVRTLPVIKTQDELETLVESFNKVIRMLYAEKENVEEKIEERTRQLNKQQEALLNVLDDIEDEKKEAEVRALELKKFQLAVEQTTGQIIMTDPEGLIIYANRATEDITGFTIKEILGKKAGSPDLWGGLMPKEFYKDMWHTIKVQKNPFTAEIKNRRKNGEEYIAKASIAPVLNREGRLVFFVATEIDITKEKQVDKMKTEFISLASHQLKTPLSAMKWFLEILLSGDAGILTKEQIDYINNINLSNERMIGLVNDLLNVSRIESGRIIVEPEPTDIKELVLNVIKDTEKISKEKNLGISTKIERNLKNINVDPKLMYNVYLNLMTNAIKYTPENGSIEVSVEIKDNKLLSSVKDTGIGIPKHQQEKIFDKFFRADNVFKKDTEGSGLGLYLVKAIIESSKGKVWFESEENKGSIFWFELPTTGMIPKEGEVSVS